MSLAPWQRCLSALKVSKKNSTDYFCLSKYPLCLSDTINTIQINVDGIGPIDHLLNSTVGFAMPIRLAAVTLCYKRDLVCYKPRDQKKSKELEKQIILDIRFLFLLRIVIELEQSEKKVLNQPSSVPFLDWFGADTLTYMYSN